MTEERLKEERRKIEELIMPYINYEDVFPQVGGMQTLNQYLKYYWLWKNRELFEDTDDYKCPDNIREILNSREKISDSRFEKIVDARNIEKSPVISSPKNEIRNLEDKFRRIVNSIVGEVQLPSGTMIEGYDFLTCHSDECRRMLGEKGISEYSANTCPLTEDNQWSFKWFLTDDLSFWGGQKTNGFISRMQKSGVRTWQDRCIHLIINHTLISLVYNQKLLFTPGMVLDRIELIFPYDKKNEAVVEDRLSELSKKIKNLNSEYPHISSNNIYIFEQIAILLDQCRIDIERLEANLDRCIVRESREERIDSMKKQVEEMKAKRKAKDSTEDFI